MLSPVAVVGAGPGLGRSLARRFGREGRPVALVARNEEKLAAVAEDLRAEGLTVGTYRADVTDEAGLTTALLTAAAELGPIGALCYCPAPDWPALRASGNPLDFSALGLTGAAQTTAKAARAQFETTIGGALTATRAVLPGMREAGEGVLLFTAGRTANALHPEMASAGISTAGLRNWIASLHAVLASEGIVVGRVAIGRSVMAGNGDCDPDAIAERAFRFVREDTGGEMTIGFDDDQ
ncbi:SDR family oxidoreductase [Nocardioides sp. cx-173]|uniref:SDR family NAD(P)-dependent oxidoreductase n=1 Tax=Nocardioides sp. cx-173 TaxID=2898796 RepID=UPI001E65834F|nr:SDR family NAD(P)-dependent oxidoreductase [Nocardioides sp. cx-173]MCD4524235.1 SDR family NAD(P)-dependent oxidoreductase [Nocardioides sp. cx-173]UGB41627.1 SDR family NAD(P)-dependent oxidoreductase [Nocardioides sp. cx-173]